MKTAQKVWITIAIFLIVAGTAIGFAAIKNLNYDFSKFATEQFVSEEHLINEEFKDIKVDVNTSDIEFVRSSDTNCMVVCIDSQKVKHNVFVENDTLFISIEDNRKWYDYIGISFGNMSITVHLPKERYDALNIKSDTSDIIVPSNIGFKNAAIETDTGNIEFLASLYEALNISTDTGDIEIKDIKPKSLKLETSTGKIAIDKIVSEKVDVESNTGDIKILNTIVDDFIVKSDTGDVWFKDCDAAQIFIKTSTGDVEGLLLSEKIFITKTSTGNISVPKTTSGGKCEVVTDTGDIKFEISKK